MKQFLHLLRGILICLAMVVLFIAGAVLWPVYLGILILKPETLDLLFSTKVF